MAEQGKRFDKEDYDVVFEVSYGGCNIGSDRLLEKYHVGVEQVQMKNPAGKAGEGTCVVNVNKYSFKDEHGEPLSVAIDVLTDHARIPCAILEGASRIDVYGKKGQAPRGLYVFSMEADEVTAERCSLYVATKFETGCCKMGKVVAEKFSVGAKGLAGKISTADEISTNKLIVGTNLNANKIICIEDKRLPILADKPQILPAVNADVYCSNRSLKGIGPGDYNSMIANTNTALNKWRKDAIYYSHKKELDKKTPASRTTIDGQTKLF